jgi:hypothetical protein
MAMPKHKPTRNPDAPAERELTEDELAEALAAFPEHLLAKTMSEWLGGAALPREIRARLGRWADQVINRPVPGDVDKVGQHLAIHVARQIAEGADLRESYAIKVHNRRAERPRHAEIANQVYQRVVLQRMKVMAASQAVGPLYNLSPYTAKNIYYQYKRQIDDELGK